MVSEIKMKYGNYRHALIWEGAIHEEPELSEVEAMTLIFGTLLKIAIPKPIIAKRLGSI